MAGLILRRTALYCGLLALAGTAEASERSDAQRLLDDLIATHSKAHALPEPLVRRVIKRESNFNPKAYRAGNWGLMQIRHTTAKSLGYGGTPEGLLDPDTNLRYAVAYLAGAFKLANGDHDRAVKFYQRGYYYEAKRKRLTAESQVAAVAPRSEDSIPTGRAKGSPWGDLPPMMRSAQKPAPKHEPAKLAARNNASDPSRGKSKGGGYQLAAAGDAKADRTQAPGKTDAKSSDLKLAPDHGDAGRKASGGEAAKPGRTAKVDAEREVDSGRKARAKQQRPTREASAGAEAEKPSEKPGLARWLKRTLQSDGAGADPGRSSLSYQR